MIEIHIRIFVKYRFLFRDWGKEDKAWVFSASGMTPVDPGTMPKDAHLLFDKFGAKLWYW